MRPLIRAHTVRRTVSLHFSAEAAGVISLYVRAMPIPLNCCVINSAFLLSISRVLPAVRTVGIMCRWKTTDGMALTLHGMMAAH